MTPRVLIALVALVLAVAPAQPADPKDEKVDIYAMRDRVEWTPRPYQWILLHGAGLK